MKASPPDTLQLMHNLVALPSVSSVSPDIDMGNLAVVETLAGWLEDLEFDIDILPLKSAANKANLVATLGKGQGGLVLAGHTDTVPFDEKRWNYDPLALTEADGRLYGMGTSDMKGFFALAIAAARKHKACDLDAPLVIVATADEESTMNGARELASSNRLRAGHVMIGEPTGLKPVRMHKGMMMEAIRLVGRSGHSSDPSLGVNAMEGMHRVLGEILAWRDDLQQRYSNDAFAVSSPTLNLGRIFGGDNPNRICAHCELHYDLRPLPGMLPDNLRKEIHERLTSLTSDFETEFRTLMESVPPFESPDASSMVKAAEQLTGTDAESAAYSTEAPFYQQCGLDAVVLGPGDIAQAHQPDEYLALDRITPTVDLIDGLIRRFCISTA